MNRRAFIKAGAAGGLSLASVSRSAAALEDLPYGQSRHGAPREVVREAYQWFVADGKPQ